MAKLRALPPRLPTLAPRLQQGSGWRAGKTTKERGYGYAWQQARRTFLWESPLCVMCEAAGRVVVATVVDHKEPHRGDAALFWDRANWQALCKPCHDAKTQREQAEGIA